MSTTPERDRDIVDPENGAKLFEVEHEARSLRHPVRGRVFVNGDPAQGLRGDRREGDAFCG